MSSKRARDRLPGQLKTVDLRHLNSEEFFGQIVNARIRTACIHSSGQVPLHLYQTLQWSTEYGTVHKMVNIPILRT